MLDFGTIPTHTLHAAPYLAAGQADAPTLEPGPVAEYRAVFPTREFRWNAYLGLWAVWEVDPVTGAETWVEYVCNWLEERAAFPGGPSDLWEYDMYTDTRRYVWAGDEARVKVGDREVVYGHDARVYRPVDYPYVRYRLREHAEFVRDGREQSIRKVNERNENRRQRVIRAVANVFAAARKESRRWLSSSERPALGVGFGAGRRGA